MQALKQFVERENAYRKIFGQPEYDLGSAQDRQKLADKIDSALSPENLTCDGELSRAQVNARYRALTGAARDLQKLDPAVRFYEFS
jgi:hypothetical protein